jgi:hypothetical protein
MNHVAAIISDESEKNQRFIAFLFAVGLPASAEELTERMGGTSKLALGVFLDDPGDLTALPWRSQTIHRTSHFQHLQRV